MADTATLQARLVEAETALHKLSTGTQRVQVDYEGIGSVTYSKANIGALRAYIAQLKSDLGQGGRTKARAVYFG